jgi:methylmalonyl-CoA mutase
VGDVGKAGVAIDSVEDMKILFDQIPLDEMSVSMTMNGAVIPIMAFYIVAAEEQGVPPEKLSGTIQNDILKEFMVRNTYIYPPGPSMRIISDIFAFCAGKCRNSTRFPSPATTCTRRRARRNRTGLYPRRRTRIHPRRHGCRTGHRRFCAATCLFLGHRDEPLHRDRQTARRALAVGQTGQTVQPKKNKSLMLRTHCQTSGWSLTEQDPFNNVAVPASKPCRPCWAARRVCTPILSTRPWLCRPIFRPKLPAIPRFLSKKKRTSPAPSTPGQVRIFVEKRTQELVEKAWALMQEVEELGGMAKAIEQGLPKLRIEEAAARKQARIDSGEEKIVGVNIFQVTDNERLISWK